MPKVNPRFLNQTQRMKYLDILWTSIAGLQTREEVKSFFKDLLSESEAIMLGRRIEVAKSLLDGKTYEEIVRNLHVGADTIGTVQRWLTSGFGGYEKALENFERVLEKRKEIEINNNLQPYSFEWLKKKYPLHFLLFNIMDKTSKKNKK
ncbi:hypothetical protein HYT45_01260 [Candidatus Uhrbacteria bacterium]|nr:hypothetical protein [Candidatus Uhrbacteria bacterium]